MRNYNTLIDRYPGADGIKTGFICASGFNLVASATRGSRRLIAVVLGARSGMQRAEKAAQLLERGFTGGGGLSWLAPSLGTVESLQPINAEPMNLRDQICNARGRRRPLSDNDEEPVAHAPEDSASPLAMLAGFQLGPPKQGSLIGPLQPSMAPIPVYTGPKRSLQAIEQLAATPPAKKKAPRKTAAHGATSTAVNNAGAPPNNARPTGTKPAAPKAATPKPAAPKSARPTAASEPAGQAKSKPKTKPAAAKQPNNG